MDSASSNTRSPELLDREVRVSRRPIFGLMVMSGLFGALAYFAYPSPVSYAVALFALLPLMSIPRGLPWKVFLTDKGVVRTHFVGPASVWCLYDEMESVSMFYDIAKGDGVEVRVTGKPSLFLYQKGLNEAIEPVAREIASRAGCPFKPLTSDSEEHSVEHEEATNS